jgi:hypothetical protein
MERDGRKRQRGAFPKQDFYFVPRRKFLFRNAANSDKAPHPPIQGAPFCSIPGAPDKEEIK